MAWQKRIAYCLMLGLVSDWAQANDISIKTTDGEYVIPESSQVQLNPRAARTDLMIFKPNNKNLAGGLPNGETPASLACVYGFTSPVYGCNYNTATTVPSGGWGAIALVDGYYNPYALNDLNTYSTQFGLPLMTANVNFFQVFANPAGSGTPCGSTQPPQGWWDEQVLDIEMAHAMAPQATIYLVSAASGDPKDLFEAVRCANTKVAPTGGVISMSWSFSEFPTELATDILFTVPGIVYISSSGDYGAPARYPSTSPNVISAGGTSIVRDSYGNFVEETAWSSNPYAPPDTKSGSSGGPSAYESRPVYQNAIQKLVGPYRGVPDIAFMATLAPTEGTIIYSSYSGGWVLAGGTSEASPALAGVINTANRRAQSTQDELSYIYSFYPRGYLAYWHDIVKGSNGFPALPGYDFVTGLGSPMGYAGK